MADLKIGPAGFGAGRGLVHHLRRRPVSPSAGRWTGSARRHGRHGDGDRHGRRLSVRHIRERLGRGLRHGAGRHRLLADLHVGALSLRPHAGCRALRRCCPRCSSDWVRSAISSARRRSALAAQGFGWRATMLGFAAMFLLATVLAAVLVRDPPVATDASGRQEGLLQGLKSIVSIGPLWLLAPICPGRLRHHRDGAGPADRALYDAGSRARRGHGRRRATLRHEQRRWSSALSSMAPFRSAPAAASALVVPGARPRPGWSFALLALLGEALDARLRAVVRHRQGDRLHLHAILMARASGSSSPSIWSRARHDLRQFPVHRRGGDGQFGSGLVHRDAARHRPRRGDRLRQSALGLRGAAARLDGDLSADAPERKAA